MMGSLLSLGCLLSLGSLLPAPSPPQPLGACSPPWGLAPHLKVCQDPRLSPSSTAESSGWAASFCAQAAAPTLFKGCLLSVRELGPVISMLPEKIMLYKTHFIPSVRMFNHLQR